MNRKLALLEFCMLMLLSWQLAMAQKITLDPVANLPATNSWREGEMIPSELKHFRESPGDMPESTDSAYLIAGVTNLALLSALVSDISVDFECREDAFAQGMYSGGPTKFFAILANDLKRHAGDSNPWLSDVKNRIAQPHVVVDALSIRDEDMSPLEMKNVLDNIERELRSGANWTTVYEKYSNENGYRTGDITKIGNLGHFVVFQDAALGHGHFVKIAPNAITWKGKELPRRLWRLSHFDSSHLPTILRSEKGDIIRLYSKDYREYVLYQVQELSSGVR